MDIHFVQVGLSVTILFFATDIHGSDICWKKFINAGEFYKADVLVLGGDLTGKAVVPIVHRAGNSWKVVLLQQETILEGEDEVREMEKRIRSRGYYPYRTTPDEMRELESSPAQVSTLFRRQVLSTLESWLTFAEEKLKNGRTRCFVAPGNDDMFEIDDLLRSSKSISLAEGQVFDLDADHQMISSGWSNITPWHTPREEPEVQLAARYQDMITRLRDPQNAIFNFHVPPYASTLDDAPELTSDLRPRYAGNSLVPAGSKACRSAIEGAGPLLGLFGHIHEARGVTRLGHTLCINPGSMYEQGCLLGALVTLKKSKIKQYILTTG